MTSKVDVWRVVGRFGAEMSWICFMFFFCWMLDHPSREPTGLTGQLLCIQWICCQAFLAEKVVHLGCFRNLRCAVFRNLKLRRRSRKESKKKAIHFEGTVPVCGKFLDVDLCFR